MNQEEFDCLESYLNAPVNDRTDAARLLHSRTKRLLNENDFVSAAALLKKWLLSGIDYTAAISLYRTFERIKAANAITGPEIKVAILGGFTTTQLSQFMELYLFAAGLRCEIYQAEYGVFRQEILDAGSDLNAFSPQVVFIACDAHDVRTFPHLQDNKQKVLDLAEKEIADWKHLWTTLNKRNSCHVIQNNFVLPTRRLLGNYDTRHIAGKSRYLSLLNQRLLDEAPDYVTIHDADFLASNTGRNAWCCERYYHHAKLPCAPEYLLEYARSIVSLIAALNGLSRKCLVLDLDNTLWGGVIGDDGLDGIRLGHGTPEGEAFIAFQQYIKGLQERGVILAVCSKNEEPNAREVFEKHPEMILKLSDIACFTANWNNKPDNLRFIAKRLDIGLDSFVFVDDNPVERAMVRRELPEVAVPELPEDPAEYAGAIDRHPFFEVISLSNEDLSRTGYYAANVERAVLEAAAGNMDDFLVSLEMKAYLEPVKPENLQRTAQLIARSNQFNLTTHRYSTAQLTTMMQDPEWVTWTVRLADKFGDNGLISVVLAKVMHTELYIDTWLMSCRVLKRGVEEFITNEIYRFAEQRTLNLIKGEYIPTKKNMLVREHYMKMGFDMTETKEDGATLWELRVIERHKELKTFVRRV